MPPQNNISKPCFRWLESVIFNMAERRMFSKQIIDSDAFLDMPLSSQALYFHLSMRADDDGFINNVKKIQRVLGCADDDLKLLLFKGFVIPFETGVCVITHWKMHNHIQKDRYKTTIHNQEKGKLTLINNIVYKLDTECIQNVSSLDTQVRLGKVREVNHCAIDIALSDPTISLPTKSRFDDFWKEYPSSQRKVAKASCEKKWQAKKLMLQADEIIAHIRSIKNSQQWTDGFAPAPLTYINQERWKDEIYIEASAKQNWQKGMI